jgi:hypothetical protein
MCDKATMPDVRKTLENLEADLIGKIDAARAELTTLERELADVRKAKSALAPVSPRAETIQLSDIEDEVQKGVRTLNRDMSPYGKLSMKELTIKALRDHFPNGATANDLLRFFYDAWGRTDVMRSSLSPQLSRLKEDKRIDRDGYRWFLLTPEKKEAPKGETPKGASEAGESRKLSLIESQVRSHDLLG